MNYKESRVYLDNISGYGSVLGLESMRELLTRLGNPQDKLKFIHIAGTNGKGSLLSYLSNILIQSGYKTGSYYSPCVFRYGEQFMIDGNSITDDEFAMLITRISIAIKEMEDDGLRSPTLFEVETALALLFFLEKNCDIAILETGLGGREDATNIIKTTVLEVLTPISMDHMAFLGDTIEKIAAEKAGIIKENTLVVSANQTLEARAVIEKVCREKLAKLKFVNPSRIEVLKSGLFEQVFNYNEWNNVHINLAGTYQFENAALALLGVEALRKKGYLISDESVYKGLKKARWNGRFTPISRNPMVIIDGAHNEAAAIALEESIKRYFPGKKVIMVIGIFKDKDYKKILRHLVPCSKAVVTIETQNNKRAMPKDKLKEAALTYSDNVTTADSIANGIELAYKKASISDVILVCGSLSFLGVAKKAVENFTGEGNK